MLICMYEHARRDKYGDSEVGVGVWFVLRYSQCLDVVPWNCRMTDE
jgi:hypothetical protein